MEEIQEDEEWAPDEVDVVTPSTSRKWRCKKNNFVPVTFDGSNLSVNPLDMSPLKYFQLYMPPELFSDMAKFTNMYALNQGIRFKPSTPEEIEILFGLHIVMGTVKLPRVSMYWDNTIGMQSFLDTLTRDRFFQLRTNLHLVDIAVPSTTDRLYKVRPIFDSLRKRCQELNVEKVVSLDEQMIPFRGQLNIKQYMKGKPTPWGIKLFMLCGISGIAYDFVIYQGKTTEVNENTESSYGKTAAVVLLLCQRLSCQGHELFFDNYFNSYCLLQKLKELNINAAGTVRINRFSKPPLLSDKECKKNGRGFSQECQSLDEDIAIVKWYDNKGVVLASNFLGIGQEDSVERWQKESKAYVTITRPQIVKEYNRGMGGVDLMDQLIALYRISVRSKKWTLRVIFHAVDMAIVNSWLEYKKDCVRDLVPAKQILDLLHFRMQIADGLLKSGKTRGTKRRGRPSLTPVDENKRPYMEPRPAIDTRKDKVDHMPEHDGKNTETRCKNNCKFKTHIICLKCKVHLCLKRDRNCFKSFHE